MVKLQKTQGQRFSQNKILADGGETAVINFLRDRGYFFVARNFNVGCGEIDAVFERGSLLLFVEVKTRSRRDCLGEGLVGFRKQQRIIAAAKVFLQRYGVSTSMRSIRFDVAVVRAQHVQGPFDIDYIEAAFTAS